MNGRIILWGCIFKLKFRLKEFDVDTILGHDCLNVAVSGDFSWQGKHVPGTDTY